MKQSGHINPIEETGTGCPVTSKYGRTPPNKHGCLGRQQQQEEVQPYQKTDYKLIIINVSKLTFMIPLLGLSWLNRIPLQQNMLYASR